MMGETDRNLLLAPLPWPSALRLRREDLYGEERGDGNNTGESHCERFVIRDLYVYGARI